uniref:Uncharacterized protein n=1 Tax=Chromera velia CCMP2878 TaxID=1169474 RepID=A0A0G4EZR6_9ALVE|eukprot:Cvel_14474.t1-p1 / transcript=Cvel_14474.t1 / gene=Cvel_14474 / organism=Chromera_velia_CCMP2878 / gene_product=hypothetical protein / transcript_product=hypothetical protein / location=Cvel_scaffold1031:11648-12616(+) / protein_length=323 / sequence_SO=supercontig / SO=protein_coding / is_pseudo=false
MRVDRPVMGDKLPGGAVVSRSAGNTPLREQGVLGMGVLEFSTYDDAPPESRPIRVTVWNTPRGGKKLIAFLKDSRDAKSCEFATLKPDVNSYDPLKFKVGEIDMDGKRLRVKKRQLGPCFEMRGDFVPHAALQAITDEVQLRKVGLGKLLSKDKGSDGDEAAEKEKEEPKASEESAAKQSVELPEEDFRPTEEAEEPSSSSALSSSLAEAAPSGAPQEEPVEGPTDRILVGMEDVAGVGDHPLSGDITDSEPLSLVASMTEGDRSDGEMSAWTMSTCGEGSEDEDSDDKDFGARLGGPWLGPASTGDAVLPQEEEKEKEPTPI